MSCIYIYIYMITYGFAYWVYPKTTPRNKTRKYSSVEAYRHVGFKKK